MRSIAALAASLVTALATHSTHAEIPIDDDGKLTVFGDFRGRIEADWDSHNSDGTKRDNQNRLRVRLRAGMTYRPNDRISLGIRLRSGSDDSQQSPHITIVDFGGNDTGDAHFNLDRWYLQYSSGNATAWIGRNVLPYWKADEIFFDDDITPTGVGFIYKAGEWTINAGYFSNPAGMKHFTGNSGLVQVAWNPTWGGADMVFAGGLISIDADPDNPNNDILLDNNGARDYTIWTGNVQANLKVMNRPLKLTLDLFHNSEGYSANDPDAFSAFHRDEKNGFVISALLGDTSEKGDWLFGYYYSHIESLALNNSDAQDDWLRWGSMTQTRTSNFKGSEFRAAVGLGSKMNVIGRLYLVEGIRLRSPTATVKEDGSRFRLDFNWSF